MNNPRETVAAAFAALFEELPGFTTISRVLEVPANVDASQMPALFIVEDWEGVGQQNMWGLAKYQLDYRLVVYAGMPDKSTGTAPGSVLNPLLDAVDLALQATVQPNEKQTLGGLVENCWINGKIFKVDGYLGQYIVAVFPISILTGV